MSKSHDCFVKTRVLQKPDLSPIFLFQGKSKSITFFANKVNDAVVVAAAVDVVAAVV
jgi:hypothetical protein